MRSIKKGFTLIELLIVVAIIAILAAIAVPNFLEAQVRSKVSRAMSDMRSLKTALEAYRVDYSEYITDVGGDELPNWARLTTPIAYITSIPLVPFPFKGYAGGAQLPPGQAWTDYMWGHTFPDDINAGIYYVMLCAGPDFDGDFWWRQGEILQIDAASGPAIDEVYNPTNGTQSSGDLIASNKRFY